MFDHLPKSYDRSAIIVISRERKERLLSAHCISTSTEEFVDFVNDALFSYFARWNFFKQRSFPCYVLKGEMKRVEFCENVMDGIFFLGERDRSHGDVKVELFFPSFMPSDDFALFIEEHRDLRVAMGCALYDFENFLFFASHYGNIGFVTLSGDKRSGGSIEKLRKSPRIGKWIDVLRIKSTYAGIPLVFQN